MKSIAKKGGPARQSAGDRTFTIVNCIIMTLVTLVIVYPLWYVLVASLTDPVIVNSGKLLLYPESFYTQGYARAFAYAPLWTGYRNTLVYTVTGSAIALICTIPAGYALSRMDLPGRRGIMFLFTFTMFFNGGIIPLYLVVQNLHIYDSIWAVVLPVAVSAYNLIVCRSFFESGIPVEMLEAAKIDGCDDFTFFFRFWQGKDAFTGCAPRPGAHQPGHHHYQQRRGDCHAAEAGGAAEILHRCAGRSAAAHCVSVPAKIFCTGRYAGRGKGLA